MSYSHRSDPSVPAFDDLGPRCVMDAHCALCARGARWIARADKAEIFRVIPLQSPLGRALMLHYGLDPEDPTSWLYLEEGVPQRSLEAVTRVARRLGGAWYGLRLLRLLPLGLQNRLYGALARNRYRLFGRGDLCALPDPAVQARLLQ